MTFDAQTPLAGPARRWPAVVRAAIEPRRVALLADISGPAFDLGLGFPDDAGAAKSTDTAEFASILSVGGLTAFADLPATLGRNHELVGEDGFFRFIEPVSRPGWLGLVGASTATHLPSLRGTHIGRDIPAALRSAGFLIWRLERFSVSTPVAPLRHFVHGFAGRYEPLRHPIDEVTDEATEGETP